MIERETPKFSLVLVLRENPEWPLADLFSRMQKDDRRAATLRELNLHHCTGCFGCWIKTPGRCVARDDGPRVLAAEITSDFVLLASPLVLGFPSALLKKMLF